MALRGRLDSSIYSYNQTSNKLVDTDLLKLQKLLSKISKKTNLSDETIITAAQNYQLFLPISIFKSNKLSSLESIVKYLHENKKLSFSKIGFLTNRDPRTIWCTYNNAQKKYSQKLDIKSNVLIPLKAIQKREFSVLESISGYLKEKKKMSFSKIALTLGLDPRTVWTCYNRLKNKRQKIEEKQ